MDLDTFNKASELQNKIHRLETLMRDAEKGFDVTVCGTYQKTSRPELVEQCKEVFLRRLNYDLEILKSQFRAL